MDIQEGSGWRLALDPARDPFGALIGGERWAVELQARELRALRHGVLRLLAQHRQLRSSLMAEEQIELELDLPLLGPAAPGAAAGSLFVALLGDRHRWSLRFVLTPAPGGRAVEGAWSPEASVALAAALERLPLPGGGDGPWAGSGEGL